MLLAAGCGSPVHAFLGVKPTEATPEIAQQFGLSVSFGALVQEVVPGSAAAKAGLRQGEVIVAFGERPVQSVEDLLAALRLHKPGDRVTLTVVRSGKKVRVEVTLKVARSASGRAVPGRAASPLRCAGPA